MSLTSATLYHILRRYFYWSILYTSYKKSTYNVNTYNNPEKRKSVDEKNVIERITNCVVAGRS